MERSRRRRRQLPETTRSPPVRRATGRKRRTSGGKYDTLLRGVTEANPYVGAARETVGEVRSVEPPEGVSFFVGGLSAGQKDFISSVYDKAPYAAAFVLGVTYLVLLLHLPLRLYPVEGGRR